MTQGRAVGNMGYRLEGRRKCKKQKRARNVRDRYIDIDSKECLLTYGEFNTRLETFGSVNNIKGKQEQAGPEALMGAASALTDFAKKFTNLQIYKI